MEPILVTGATGLLGNNVLRRLLDQGYRARVLVRKTHDPRVLANLDVETVIGDITDLGAVRRAATGVNGIIHCAAFVHFGWTCSKEHSLTNTIGSRNVSWTALELNLRLVHVSTADTLGLCRGPSVVNENTTEDHVLRVPYVVSKREAERRVFARCAKGLNAIVVNPAYMLGPYDWKPSSGRMLLQVAQHPPIAAPGGGHSFCDVRDVADAVIEAYHSNIVKKRFVLGGTNLSFKEAWRMFANVTGKRGPIFSLGPIIPNIAGFIGDIRTKVTGTEGDINSATTRSARQFRWYDSSRAEDELGYRRRPLEETIEDAWAWFTENGYV